ncbi:ABC transporter permease, partial [mine drainage metagenome]
LAVVTPALLSQWQRELPPDTPNWFALNVQGAQRASFAQQVAQAGGTKLNMLPLVVGNLSTINGVPIAQRHFADAATRRWAEQTLRLSWSAQPPPGNRVVAGHWFSARPRMAEVSVDRGWARRFGIKLGDTLGFQVGEHSLDARVTSLREVRWDSFRVNFFLLLDPLHGHSLPHNWLASFYLPAGQATRLQATSRALPNVSLIDVDSLLARLRGIVAQVGAALRWVLGFSLLAGALVLVAALTASARERRHEAALLRTLGADRR